MNLYLRYFDDEVLVHNVDEALDFLKSLVEINVTDELEQDLREYASSNVYYPKRYKVRSRIYFIVIKTEAATMLDFKQKKALRTVDENSPRPENAILTSLKNEKYGWYEGTVAFKRVKVIPITGKCEYHDTVFTARVKADSPMDCYERIVAHLSERVDRRSQFPSPKGKNYTYKFLGLCK